MVRGGGMMMVGRREQCSMDDNRIGEIVSVTSRSPLLPASSLSAAHSLIPPAGPSMSTTVFKIVVTVFKAGCNGSGLEDLLELSFLQPLVPAPAVGPICFSCSRSKASLPALHVKLKVTPSYCSGTRLLPASTRYGSTRSE
eukprot:763686-Hanusia_phi.AAC.2